ncbi:MAG: HEPN domain-containing protein [Lachnospiraceae bacterium]|nr:HEPN domain-containing protein [Lachnospiraceae bacterium]
MTLTLGLIRADIIAARQAIEYYDLNGNREIKNVAAYHIQQAVEKLIKYQIYQRAGSVSNSQMYTHNIERLIVYGDSLDIGIIVPRYVRDKSLRITDWEAGSRYDVGFSIRIDLLRRTYEVVVNWFEQL